jgi:hypothetical protein
MKEAQNKETRKRKQYERLRSVDGLANDDDNDDDDDDTCFASVIVRILFSHLDFLFALT